MADTGRISGGATAGTPTCPTCPHLLKDKKYPGHGWCNAPQNRVMDKGWVNGFTPSQSPSGSCNLHPERAHGVAIPVPARLLTQDERNRLWGEHLAKPLWQQDHVADVQREFARVNGIAIGVTEVPRG